MNSSLASKLVGLGVTGAIVGMIVAAQFWAFMPPKDALATTATPSWTRTPPPTPTVPDTFPIYGQVCYLYPPECGALAGVIVRLEPVGRETQTNSEGQFRFDGVANGAYTIHVGQEGTLPQYQPINVNVYFDYVYVTISPIPVDLLRCGDVTGDGHINSLDAALTLQYVVRLKLHLPHEDVADADGDGHISPVDAALMLQMDAGFIHLGLPPCSGAV